MTKADRKILPLMTPRQLAIDYVAKMVALDDIDQQLDSGYADGSPEQLEATLQGFYDRIRKQTKDTRAANHAIRTHEAEFGFLWQLWCNVHGGWLSGQRERRLIRSLVHFMASADERYISPDYDEATRERAIKRFEKLITSFLTEVLSEQEAVKMISTRYYGGIALLTASELAEGDNLCNVLEDYLWPTNEYRASKGLEPITRESLAPSIQASAKSIVRSRVTLAKAEVLTEQGQRKEGLEMVRQMLKTS